MTRSWAGVARLIDRLTLRRAIIIVSLLSLLGGCLLAYSIVLDEVSAAQPRGPQPAVAIWPSEPLPPVDELLPVQEGEPGATPSPAGAETQGPSPAATRRPRTPGQLNLLLLGTDRRRPGDAMWRTDTIIVAVIRPQERTLAMFSIPRDLWVDIPGRGPERINVVDCYGERVYGRGGGPRLVSATLDRNFGITTDAYVRVDFGRLERVIDALGGITITSDRALDDWLDDGSPALLHFQLAAGTHHLDGHTAMLYARTRRQTGDLDRCRRQQQIILAMREAALSPGILPRLPELLSALWGTVETDLPLTRVLSLMRLAGRIDRGSIRTRVFNSNMVRDWVTPAGAMVLLPNRALIVQAWDEVTAP